MTKYLIIILFLLASSCSEEQKKETYTLGSVAEEFVRLCHATAKFDSDFVDAYFGPDSLKELNNKDTSLRHIKVRSNFLRKVLDTIKIDSEDTPVSLRKNFLDAQFQAMNSRINYLIGYPEKFDEECENIYRAKSPNLDSNDFKVILEILDKLLIGGGSIQKKYNDFKDKFIIPKDKIDTVFRTAIAEARRRTKKYFDFLPQEDFKLEYVTDKAWSGYNWFQGMNKSLIQINLDQPIYIDRAIDLAAHEGYPGHHTFHSSIEQVYALDSGWVEYSIYPLFSPMSLISEGSANFGIKVAFPGEEKLKFEKEVLYPLAGLDSSKADKFAKVQSLVHKLTYAGNVAAQKYLDGEFTDEEATNYLIKYNLMTRSRAEQRLKFIEKYRSYVINYNVGQDLIEEFINSQGGTEDNPGRRWILFRDLLRHPYLADQLQEIIDKKAGV